MKNRNEVPIGGTIYSMNTGLTYVCVGLGIYYDNSVKEIIKKSGFIDEYLANRENRSDGNNVTYYQTTIRCNNNFRNYNYIDHSATAFCKSYCKDCCQNYSKDCEIKIIENCINNPKCPLEYFIKELLYDEFRQI